MNLFESVKSSITTREAAEHYGIHVGRSGMCRCPFHNDRTPSMKADERFHCFGCQADGDVISFTSRLFDLSPKDAALKLASDFGIAYDEHLPLYIVRKHPEISKEERFQHQASYCFSELAAYRNQLVQWQEQYAPQSPDDDLHPRFLEALHHLDDVEYQLDVLQYGTDQERQEAVQEYMQNQTKPQEVTTMRKDFDPIPVYYETAAHAREHGELDLFRLSHQENIACKRDIEDAIARHFDGMHLDNEAVTEVLDQYGEERVSVVLAATVQIRGWDGRFSSSNKDWACSVTLPEAQAANGLDRRDDYTVASHSTVLDGFIRLARKEIKERRRSLSEEKSSPATMPETKTPKHKSHDMER
ncbi:DUF3849 domain-containing protein [Butyricicoccus sp.]|uniref:DUF3849 domain-containing protein n=1 Tax=Butyricicoccus sp. TaxID=2049021 RepID=UPI003AAFD846